MIYLTVYNVYHIIQCFQHTPVDKTNKQIYQKSQEFHVFVGKISNNVVLNSCRHNEVKMSSLSCRARVVNHKSSQCRRWHPGLLRCSVVNDTVKTLQWRHNEHDSVSNQQLNDCLLKHLFRRRSKKTSKLRVTGLRAGIHRRPLNSPHKGPVTLAMFPFDDVLMR